MKTHTTKKKTHFDWYYNLITKWSLMRTKTRDERGYAIDSYVIWRYIWITYWKICLSAFLFYSVPLAVTPVLAVWYANTLGLALLGDTISILTLYVLPVVLGMIFILVGCFVLIKKFCSWLNKRNQRLIAVHFELKAQKSDETKS